MASTTGRPPTCTVTRGESGGVPANVRLETDRARLSVNIHAIEGSVSVGQNNSLTYVRNGPDSSSSDSDSDSDVEEFCQKHGVPNPKDIRNQMKGLNIGTCRTLIMTAGSDPVFLDSHGNPVNPATRQANARPSGAGGTQPGRPTSAAWRSGNQSQNQTGRNTARAPAQSMSTAQPTASAQRQPSSYQYGRTQYHGMTALDEKRASVDRVLKTLPEPYRIVDEALIRMITPHFGTGWRRVFRFLSLPDEAIDLTYQDSQGNGVSEAVHRLLLEWSRQTERPQVYMLAKALALAEHNHAIEALKSASMAAITR